MPSLVYCRGVGVSGLQNSITCTAIEARETRTVIFFTKNSRLRCQAESVLVFLGLLSISSGSELSIAEIWSVL